MKLCLQCRKPFGSNLSLCPHDGSMLVSMGPFEGTDPFIGTVLADRYEIVSLAGKGGMGVVYKARHRILDRFVAVKVLKSDLVFDEKSFLRFQVEAVAASRLSHPNVIAVYDYGVSPTGQPYLIMDFVQGTNLAKAIFVEGSVDFKRALPIFIQACNGLDHAHHNEIIHRDVKPSNIILLQTEGQPDFVKIVDFGIAQLGMFADEGLHLTRTGEICGSPLYMSPEQCTGDSVDQRTDVYSLGAAMYEALVGVAPIVGKNSADTIRRKLSEDVKPFKLVRATVAVPEPVEAVVLKALEREPRRRFQSMQQFKSALEAAMQGVSVVRLSSTGLPEMSEFTGIDVMKEIEKVPMSVDKIKAKAKAAKLLGSEKESPEMHIAKSRSNDQPKQQGVPLPFAAGAGMLAILLIAIVAWFAFANSHKSPTAARAAEPASTTSIATGQSPSERKMKMASSRRHARSHAK